MAKKAKKKLRMHTHAQYVALHNSEDRLLAERFIALVFATSFFAVVWATGDSIGLWGRLSVAVLGLLVTLLLWRVIFRAAQAAEDWRRFAIREEWQLYGPHPDDANLPKGPYGLRRAIDQAPGNLIREWITDKSRYFNRLRCLSRLRPRLRLGRTNAVSAFFVPLILVAWWGFAIWNTFDHDWKVAHHHTAESEVSDSVENEAD